MKHVILAGNPKPTNSQVKKFAWLTKEELATRVQPEYWKSIEGML
jgi:hypothetical protein